MDSKGDAIGNDLESSSISNESPDVCTESNDGAATRDSDAWLHLKTITTFSSEVSIQKATSHYCHSCQKYHESSQKTSCKLEGSLCNDASRKSKQTSQRYNLGHKNLSDCDFDETSNFKHQDSPCSKANDKKETAMHRHIFINNDRAMLKQTRRRRHSWRRSRNSSLSEGCSPHGTVPEEPNQTSSSSNFLRNGTVSDAGGDYVGSFSAAPARVQSLTRFSPTSLLVESLIDQLCRLMEKDTARQKKLYHVICERLHQMQLIDDTYTIEEFQFMRSHYQRALYQLLAVAKSSTQQSTSTRNILLPLPSSNVNIDVKLYSEQVLEWSRYKHEYQELEYIAKGGFGHVYKVQNKLDGGQYAIKKIFLRYRYVEGFLRSLKEVKMLARLNHPNIVSYKAAWLEPMDDDARKAQMRKTSRSSTSGEASIAIVSVDSKSRLPLPPARQDITEDSLDIVFQESSPNTDSKSDNKTKPKSSKNSESSRDDNDESMELRKSRTRLLSDLLGTNVLLQPSSSSSTDQSMKPTSLSSSGSDSSDEAAVCPLSKRLDQGQPLLCERSSSATFVRNWATLYVQMQLCERTLRQWLDVRNASLAARPLAPKSCEGTLALSLFKKIVRGVDYIHSQGIVHHDIKPSNIFVNTNLKEVQVGDFGLSCCLLSRVDRTGVVGEHHGEVGTRMYAAPEQLRGKCNPRSDIFSLGIVLLELLQPFHTDMERSKVIERLRKGCIPPELSTTWPLAARLMSDLLVTSPSARPTASELLQRVDSILRANEEDDISSQLASKDETIRLLKEAVASRDQEIAELRQKLSLLQKE